MDRGTTDLQAQRLKSLGRLLGLSWAIFERRVVERVRRDGFADFRPPHASLTRSMSPEGVRLTVLAERAGISKQAMGQLVAEAEHRGWVRTSPDPDDGRAKLVTYTAKGLKLAATIVKAANTVEAELRKTVGRKGVVNLRGALERWLDEVYPDHRAFWSVGRLAGRR